MEPLLEHLQALLGEETALHEGLRGDLAHEAEHDGKLPAAEFLRLQQRKYHWINRIEAAEAKRIEVVRQLAAGWQVEPRQLTLRDIATRVEAPRAEAFQAQHAALTALVNEIRHLARETGANAQARQKAIDATLAVIGDAVKMHPTYSEAGRLQKRTPTFKSTSA